jgi:hypothetical protein
VVAVAVLLFFLVARTASSSEPQCTYYAAPHGTGDGLTATKPFTIAAFWRVATPGSTLCLASGTVASPLTYRGPSNMLAPGAAAPGLSGTASSPIAIRAITDGGVVIDGEFVRRPFHLKGNRFFVIEGLNFRNGSREVIEMERGTSDIIVRRVVAWDAIAHYNTHTVHTSGVRILFEDLAIFGVGRSSLSVSQGSDSVTCRRCWARWEGSINQGPKSTYQTVYRNHRFTCENCLATWFSISMPKRYELHANGVSLNQGTRTTIDQPSSLFGANTLRGVENHCARSATLGSLAYLKAGEEFEGLWGLKAPGNKREDVNCYTIKHSMIFVPPTHTRWSVPHSMLWLALLRGGGEQLIAQNVTSVRPTDAQDFVHAAWVTSHFSQGTSLAAVADPWTSSGDGANLCNRWVDSVPTTIPLWPWPMNDRIKAATAAAGAYRGPCPTCVGGRAPRIATDVTADIQTLLGNIPPQCRSE